jgi:CHASE1-domain containing sensor protein
MGMFHPINDLPMRTEDTHSRRSCWLSRWAHALGCWRVALLGGIFICGLTVSVVVFWLLREHEVQLVKIQFSHQASDRLQTIQSALNKRLAALKWIKAFYAASLEVERSEFSIFTRWALATTAFKLLMLSTTA